MEDYGGLNLWETLPEECKSIILSRLSNKEAARIARDTEEEVFKIFGAFYVVKESVDTVMKILIQFVSKEFDGVVKNIRDSVQLLVVPPDLSPTALEGFVASHRNLKSLSFKRCSSKVKRFLPILEAAAGGKLDSKWYHRRSLESVDFRSCTFLTDVDVNALCVLHSRLEDVNLANCSGISDVALTVLSRYQQSRPDSGEIVPVGSATPKQLLEETEESSMLVIQNPTVIREGPDTFWPELSSSNAQSKLSSKVATGDVAWGPLRKHSSESVGLPRTFTEASDRASEDEGQNSKTTNPIPPLRSYAQAALKAVDSSPLMVLSNTSGSNVDVSSPLVLSADTKSFVNTTCEQVALPHIDWTSVLIPSSTVDPSTSSSNDSHLIFSRTPTPTPCQELAVEEPDQGKLNLFSTRKKKGNRGKLVDVKNSSTALPERMDTLQLDPATKGEFLQSDDMRLPSPRRLDKVVVDDDGKGRKFHSLDFEPSGDRRLATRRSLHIPDSYANTSEAEYHKLVEDFKASKVVRVGGAKQVTDQRLEMPSHKSVKDRVEAFRTTHSEMGLFMISRDNTSDRRPDCSDAENPLQFNLPRNGKKGSQRSQESIPLPAGLEGLQVGTMMKHCKHKDIAPELLEYQLETPIFFGKGDEEHWKARGLRSVSLAGCSDITDKGVQALLRGPSKDSLVSLDISRCSGVTSTGLRLPPVSVLEKLTAAQLPNIPRLFMQLSSEGSLRHLSLAACPKLEDLHLVAPYLETLNVSNCKKLSRLQLKCPMLLSCNLSLCESLETIARFTCGSLQIMNVYGCRLLRPVGFATILDVTVSLRELRCGGCDRLDRLEIPQATLVRLEAQGCTSLRRLNVQSRMLKSVDACGCKNLAEVYLFSPDLRRMLFSNCALLQTLVIPLDAMKQSVDLAVKNRGQDPNASHEGLEISISGCNVPESVQKNLARLSKQWKTTFAS